MRKIYKVYQNAWRENHDANVDLTFPENWIITEYKVKADEKTPLTKEEIRRRIQNPTGMPSIYEMAKAGSEAVIVFDDLSRGTPVKVPAEIVLEELRNAGIAKENIRFLCATGNHAPLTRADFVMKLGEEIVENYAVYNHNPYEHLVCAGINSHGDEVFVNREFMNCDIRIGIGSVSPHPMNGFGGGGKLVFPGLAGRTTSVANHGRREFKPFSKEKCGFREDIESMTDMIRPFFKIDAILNSKLEIVELCAGDPVEEYYKAIEISYDFNFMEQAGELKDVVVVNANAKYNEAQIAVRIGMMDLKEGGDLVLINHCPQGPVVHYLYSSFGKEYGGACWQPYDKRIRQKAGRIIYFTPYPDVMSKNCLNEPEKVVFAKNWDEVLSLLSEHGDGTSVSLITDGTISCFR